MSVTFRCDDKEMLVAYLYGELDSDGRREVERHARGCAECTREIDALQSVRLNLQSWAPPDADLGFTVVAKGTPATVLTSPRWASLRGLPAWAQVAAAALIVGVSAAIANVQVRSTSEGLVVSTGWMAPATPAGALAAAAPATAVAATSASEQEWRRELAALEQSLRGEIAAQQSAIRLATTARGSVGGVDDAAVLQRVRAMIEDSEKRQRDELTAWLVKADRSWTQRYADTFKTINQRVSTLQGRTIVVEAGQQEIANRLRRVAWTPNQ